MPTSLDAEEDKWKTLYKSKVILPSHNIFCLVLPSTYPFNNACTHIPIQHLTHVCPSLHWVLKAPTEMSESRPHGLYSLWNSTGQNTGVGSLSILRRIFPTQGWNPGLPHCGWILYQPSHKGSPRILEWVAYPFSSGSSWPMDQTGVSCLASRFFTNWAIREAQTQMRHGHKPKQPKCRWEQLRKQLYSYKVVWQEQRERDYRCILIKKAQNLDQVDKVVRELLKKKKHLNWVTTKRYMVTLACKWLIHTCVNLVFDLMIIIQGLFHKHVNTKCVH